MSVKSEHGAASHQRPSSLIAEAAPTTAAILAFLAGAATVISAANPSNHPRAVDAISLIEVEAPSIGAGLIGIAQMALADGLRRRVDASMYAAATLSLLSAAYFFFHHVRYLDAGLQIAFAAFLFASRSAFYRRARAFSIRLPFAWFAGVGAVLLIAAIGAVLWAATHPAFRTAPFHALLTDPVIGRGGRPIAVAAIAFAIVAIWRYAATVRRTPPPPPGPDEFSRAAAALERASEARPEAMLCFSGDLSFLFSPSGRSFIGYASYGSSLIALAEPTGDPDERRALMTAFCDLADRQNLRPVFYAAPASLLPDLLDLGFKVEKIGENAVIALENFSLSGKARESLRYSSRKLSQRDGAHFEMRRPPHAADLIDALRPVSDAWLKAQGASEKRFSLGRFETAFLNHCPLAVVTIGGNPVAFGSILLTPDNKWAAIDLMRYDLEKSPPGTMDFLLTEMLLWAKDAGVSKFDLSMAPLSGLADERFAPLFARLGRLIFEQGGRWYNFEGLRNFKEKFRPTWEPRYLAARGALSLPVALAEIAMLTNSAAPADRAERSAAPSPA